VSGTTWREYETNLDAKLFPHRPVHFCTDLFLAPGGIMLPMPPKKKARRKVLPSVVAVVRPVAVEARVRQGGMNTNRPIPISSSVAETERWPMACECEITISEE
jgi:hypothetical protein